MTKNIIILGKPNAGKSSLLNALLGKQIAVVNNYEGLTRDLKIIELKILENEYSIIDSPGISSSKNSIEKEIKLKTILSIEKCDLILLVIDGKKNLTNDDFEIFKIVRKSQKQTILIINKTEGKINLTTLDACNNLGFGSPIKISTAHMQGIDQLKYLISEIIPNKKNHISLDDAKELSIAIVGKTNSGKSTLLNSIKGENLSITGEIPNLTRDAVETTIKNNLFESKIIDTAGFSQRDSRLIKQIQQFENGQMQPVKKYLVAQANTQYPALQRIIEAYDGIELNGCIFTKLDECYSLGEVLSAAVEYQLPVSYVTDGQKVPEDIKVAEAKSLVSAAAKLYKKYGLNHTSSNNVIRTARAV